MNTIIFAATPMDARRSRRPRAGETVAYRGFSDFEGVAEKGFKNFEIIGECEIIEDIEKAYAQKPKKDKKS